MLTLIPLIIPSLIRSTTHKILLLSNFNAFFQKRSLYFLIPSLLLSTHPSHSNMSMISFYFLLLFLICISFHHPCHSQCLQLDHNKFQNQLQAAPIKCKIGKMVISREEAAIECMKLSSPKPAEEEESFRSKRQKYKRRRKQLIKRLTRESEKVSWKVPHDDDNDDHKKVIGNDGVFSSDYEHARTHPPSHN